MKGEIENRIVLGQYEGEGEGGEGEGGEGERGEGERGEGEGGEVETELIELREMISSIRQRCSLA